MDSIKQLENRIIERIDKLYSSPIADYNKRIIDKDHVLNYFYGSYYRTREIVRLLSGASSNNKILDIGIGYGFHDIILNQIYGLDIAGMEVEENISSYSKLPKSFGIDIFPGKLSSSSHLTEQKSYDTVIFSEVIEHIRISPMKALLEIKHVLKTDGRLIITTPNIARLTNIIKLCAGFSIIEEFPDEDSGLEHITDKLIHIREYTMRELKGLIRRAGFTIELAKYSISHDRVLAGPKANFTKKIKRLLLQSACFALPPFRSLLIIVCRKN